MEPTTVYCLFMLSCFSSRLSGGIYELDCPAGCDCFSASSDGISGDTSLSFICDQTAVLHRYSSFRSSHINTLVVRLSPIFISSRPQSSRKHPTLSLVLEQCTLGTPTDPSNIFQLLDPKSLQYLTITQSTLFESKTSLDWTHLSPFTNLQTLYIEDTTGISTLDQTFSSFTSPHTITIKRCPISHIDREAFSGKENTLQRLTITGTEIQNFLWLTANKRRYNSLWYLDLRDNQLLYLPEGATLQSQLPKIQVLYLAQNNLRHFSPAQVFIFFQLSEFMLLSDSTGAYHQRAYPPVIYNTEMSDVRTNLNGFGSTIIPAHVTDSFHSYARYECRISRKSTTTSSWDNLKYCQTMIYNFYPDNLFLDHNGQLTISKSVSNTEVLDQVKIDGFDLNALQMSAGKLPFYLDSIKTADNYRQARAFLISQLDDLIVSNSLRINLFSSQTFDSIIKSDPIDNIEKEFSILIDFIEDILNVAEAKKKYVLLVMWKYEDINWDLASQPAILGNIFQRMRAIVRPLYTRIGKMPSLIGTEVMSNFLSGEFTSPSFLVNTDCTSAVKHFNEKLKFLGYSIEFISLASTDNLVGVNIPGNCQYCLHGAMRMTCQGKLGFGNSAESVVNFISITSTSSTDFYSPERWATSKPQWFDALYLKENDQSPNRPIRPGVFFILEDGQKNADILNWATGVFVASPEQTMVYNLVTDDTFGDFTV